MRYLTDYWGKARAKADHGPRWHPLAFHCLDVAAVADDLLTRWPRRLDLMARAVGAQPEALRPFVLLLVGLHDIGKISQVFQSKSELGPKGPLKPFPSQQRHDAAGRGLWGAKWSTLQSVFASYLASNTTAHFGLLALWQAVTGHHGAPVDAAAAEGFLSTEKQDVAAFVGAFAKLFPPPSDRLHIESTTAHQLSWHLAGLTTISDWIGSNEAQFGYQRPDDFNNDLAVYWVHAKATAGRAVDRSGILPSSSPRTVDARHLLAHIDGEHSPLQKKAFACDLPEGPMLAILEDTTGSGKTEAALVLAARLMAEGRASGLFFGLPTMATANAMYGRLATSYRRLFDDAAMPSLVLAHGKRALNPAFRDSILEVDDREIDDATDVPTSSATCAAWIADDRRTVFLADVGVGTIDQALLGVLPSRHQILRLWGLADHVLIVDEAHSFDSYLSRELEILLEFHAALGGSAVVLSATLSTDARARLVQAFQRGLGVNASTAAEEAPYPLLTLVGREANIAEPVATRADIARDLNVRCVSSVDEVVAHVVAMSDRGATVAWVRNTVDDCQDAYARLQARGIDPILLHARFAMVDRLRIEDGVQRLLGRDSTPETRKRGDGKGLVLLGSQILEQSLDYDVDAMVSDLAPIDMLIQRAGRLWRHPHRNDARPIGVDEREFVVLSPNPEHVTSREWYRELLAGAAAVYPDHGFVWRSAKVLADEKRIVTPGGIRDLLAAVYDGDAPALPADLQRASREADGQRYAFRSIATNATLTHSVGYGGNYQQFANDQMVMTRLGEEVTVFRLARWDNGRLVPWAGLPEDDRDIMRAWALSECAVRKKKADGVPPPARDLHAALEALRSKWPQWEQDIPLLILEPGPDGVWLGNVRTAKGENVVEYRAQQGWRQRAS